MTIETRNASSSASKSHQQITSSMVSKLESVSKSEMMEAGTRTSSVSSNGYQPDSPSEDDGYYTSAVSVQHKVKATFNKLSKGPLPIILRLQ